MSIGFESAKPEDILRMLPSQSMLNLPQQPQQTSFTGYFPQSQTLFNSFSQLSNCNNNISVPSNNNIQNVLKIDNNLTNSLQQQILLLQAQQQQQQLQQQQQQQQQQQFQQNANIQALLQQMQLNSSLQQQPPQLQSLFPANFLSLLSQQQPSYTQGLQQTFNSQQPFQSEQLLQQQLLQSQPLNRQVSLLLSNNFLAPTPVSKVKKTQQSNQMVMFTPAVKEEEQDDNDLEDRIANEEEDDEDDQVTAGENRSRKNSNCLFNNGVQSFNSQAQLQQFISQQQQQQQSSSQLKSMQDPNSDERARSVTAPVYFPLTDYQKILLHSPVGLQKSSLLQNFSAQHLPTQQIIQMHQPSNTQLSEFQLGGMQSPIIPSLGTPNNLKKSSVSFQTSTLASADQVKEFKKQMGIIVRDKETLAPFLEHWNSQQESEQVLAKSYDLLRAFSREGSAEYENEFQVEYLEDSQKCNYVNKFINSKGLIVKDEKFGKIKIENKISRFHNLSRLLMYTILTAFHKNNLALMNLDPIRQEAIIKMIQRLKQSARKKTPKGLIKTDFFNHTHYNVLFLTINEHNIDQVRKNQKDISTHHKVFNINLEKPFAEIQEDLRYSNIIKKLAYHIMLASYKKSKDDKRDSDLSNSSNSTYREQYIDRAMIGISKLNQGVLIQRF